MAAPTNSSSSSLRRRVLIDTDGGCDDAVAILLALKDPRVEVVALTSVFGNVTLEQATENVFTILRVFDKLDSIPFYEGAGAPLVVDQELDRWPGHGENGLGDASFLEGGETHHHQQYMEKVTQEGERERERGRSRAREGE
jgi:inosine-uridine nucleoside N-ribohydrolase